MSCVYTNLLVAREYLGFSMVFFFFFTSNLLIHICLQVTLSHTKYRIFWYAEAHPVLYKQKNPIAWIPVFFLVQDWNCLAILPFLQWNKTCKALHTNLWCPVGVKFKKSPFHRELSPPVYSSSYLCRFLHPLKYQHYLCPKVLTSSSNTLMIESSVQHE